MAESAEERPRKKFTRREVVIGGTLVAAAMALGRDSKPMRERVEKPRDAFERKFYARKQIPVGNTTVEVADVSPEIPNDKIPILLNTGWGVSIEAFKPGIRRLSGIRRTLCLNHLRRGGDITLSEDEKKLLKDFPEEEIRRTLTVEAIVKHEKLSALNVIGSSEDAMSTMCAALLLDERAKKAGREHGEIRNIILDSPIGFIGKDTFWRLARGQIQQNVGAQPESLKAGSEWPGDRKITPEMRDQAAAEGRTMPEYAAVADPIEAAGLARVLTDAVGYVGKNPLRSYREIAGMVKAQVAHLLRELKARNIGVVVVTAVDDPVVPTERVSKTISGLKSAEENSRASFPQKTEEWEKAWSEDITRIAEKLFDGVLAIRGKHAKSLHPDFLEAEETVFTSLEAKQGKKLQAVHRIDQQ